jgi:hypothetical protein
MDDSGRPDAGELTLEPATVVRTRRPRALWAVLAAVGLAAGALVVTSAGEDGAQRPGLPVAFGSGSGGRSEGAIAADSMLAWITYVAGDDLPALGGEAPAYRLPGDVDEGQVRALADALGIDGEIKSDGAGSWSITGEGFYGRLDVRSGGGASWSYFAGHSDCVQPDGGIASCYVETGACIDASGPEGCGNSEAGNGADGCTDDGDCVEPTTTILACPDDTGGADPRSECTDGYKPPPAADLPPLDGEEDAKDKALAVVAASGADVDGAVVDARAGGESRSWYVSVETVVDGIPSGMTANVEVSESGVVISGDGFFGTPERLGDYPLLDTRAVIDRANEQQGDASPVGRDTPVDSGSAGDDPCASPEDASDGCGGTTGGVPRDHGPVSTIVTCEMGQVDCGTTGGSVGEPTTTAVPPCKPPADDSEICVIEPGITCPQAAPPADEPVGAPESIECTPPTSPPDPAPIPEPTEVVLVDAEPTLVLLAANDGSTDAYLVPAYRFTDADGGRVDLPAVADESLTTPQTTVTEVPEAPILPDPGGKPPVDPQPCGPPLVEEDESSTTHTVQPNPDCVDPELAIGVEYYVDIDTECGGGTFVLGGEIWKTDDAEVAGWADPGERHEGGLFTLDAADHGTFVGDTTSNLVAEFYPLGPAEDVFCSPQPRP